MLPQGAYLVPPAQAGGHTLTLDLYLRMEELEMSRRSLRINTLRTLAEGAIAAVALTAFIAAVFHKGK